MFKTVHDLSTDKVKDVKLSPEEEALILAGNAKDANDILMPIPMTNAEEMDLLLSGGTDAVKAARAKYQDNLSAWQLVQQPLEDAYKKAADAYETSMNNLELTKE